MEYFTVKNWRKFQHYTDRNPPWIKLHFEMLSSSDWVMLDDRSRVLAVACMLVASRNEGRVPVDPAYLKRVAYLNKTPDFKPLIRCGFLECASTCKQTQAEFRPETETETETETEIDAGLPQPKPHDVKIKQLDHVYLTEKEMDDLISRFGEEKAWSYVERLDAYIGSKGVKYKSHYKTIISWSLKDSRP